MIDQVGAPGRLLRRHVLGCAEHHVFMSQELRVRPGLRDAEVEQLDQTSFARKALQKHVGRLEIAVERSALDERRQAPASCVAIASDRRSDRALQSRSRRRARVSPSSSSMTRKGSPLSVVSKSITLTMCGWLQPGQHLGFAAKSEGHRRIVSHLGGQELHRDQPLQSQVLRLVNDCHSADVERTQNAIGPAESSADVVRIATPRARGNGRKPSGTRGSIVRSLRTRLHTTHVTI